ncbi:acetamidase/formamidase family protein [Clostridium manihotivorum]|uniref:Acetamidase n=1 Tax=Clostridium manihotivorum TaxID=2320868 RepID=A0A3R5QTR1_9CLOT|nr:acetamidase/formamidase family protein [Clostridium manihotivorum]QAA32404.1 acetamidase [Clostridium manihotivorum]
MIIIKTEHVIHNMSKDNKPVAFCKSGDIVEFHTLDCFNNELLPEGTKCGVDNKSIGNPATGPLYIEGAKQGDTLKVEILDITVGTLGVNVIGSNCNSLSEKNLKFETKRLAVEQGIAKIIKEISVPIEPMIGVIGVAPAYEEISTFMPGNHGGNMDCRQIKKGSVLYLPVFTEGALLAIGDIHALMGDGEVGGCGLEIEGTIKLKVTVIPEVSRRAPAVFVDGKWMAIASCSSLDEAADEATAMMLSFLVEEVGLDSYDAGVLLSLCGNLAVCQKVNSYKTVRMELPLCYLSKFGYVPY